MAATPSTSTKAGGNSSALFAGNSKPCKKVDMKALGQAAGMTLVKAIPSSDNGCLWGAAKVGVGVQVSVHPAWTASYLAALKAPHPGGAKSKVTDVTVAGASSAIVLRAALSGAELDNLYAIFPKGGVEVAVTGPPAVATVARAVAAAGVILQ